LLALCELLHTPSGFIVTMKDGRLATRVSCGAPAHAASFLSQASLPLILQKLAASRTDEFIANSDLVRADGHWLLPLKSRSDGSLLGVMGLWSTAPEPAFSDEELMRIYGLVSRAELALEDMRLQRRIFGLLEGMDVEIREMQAWRAYGLYGEERVLAHEEADLTTSPGFSQAVKDALTQFWGGPKLTKSPLVQLRVVTERLAEHDNVPARALRSVLQEAIERQRPDGARSLTASEWTIYNILEMRFVQGIRARDIPARLAMSESDYFRKQRVAIEEVADTLAQMERTTARREDQLPPSSA
ncbi:MAG: hypothetical protein ABFD20_02875, partial [Anaerolineales bacterium]